MSFAKGRKAQARKAAKATRAKSLVPKRLGVSAIEKGPARDEKHLALVREQRCLVTGVSGQYLIAAHHPKGMFPRTTGVRISDLLTVPLLHRKHTLYADSLHEFKEGPEREWWRRQEIDVYAWLRQFLLSRYNPQADQDVATALRMITQQEAKEKAA